MNKFKINKLLALSLTTAISLTTGAAAVPPQIETGYGSSIIDAANNGDLSQVQILLTSGANPNQRGDFGTTPLMRAVYNNNLQLANLLLNSGAKTDMGDIGGATPLSVASRQGYNEILNLLIQRGADVNAADNEGFTPLMRAGLHHNKEAMATLLQNGASINQANEFGETALSLANKENNQQVAALLTSSGADDALKTSRPAKVAVKQKASENTQLAMSDDGDQADIVIDFSKGRLSNSKTAKTYNAPVSRQIASIEKPDYYVGSFYVPNNNALPLAPVDNLERLEIPKKPMFAPQQANANDKWFGDLKDVVQRAMRPYQISSNDMVFPGEKSIVIDLGNFKSEDFANKKIAKLKQSFPEVFADLPLKTVAKNSGSHVSYQINAGLVNSSDASEICRKLLASGINCRPTKSNFKTQDEFNTFSSDATTAKNSVSADNKSTDLLGAAPSASVQSKQLAPLTPSAGESKSFEADALTITRFKADNGQTIYKLPAVSSNINASDATKNLVAGNGAYEATLSPAANSTDDEKKSLPPADAPLMPAGQAVVIEPSKNLEAVPPTPVKSSASDNIAGIQTPPVKSIEEEKAPTPAPVLMQNNKAVAPPAPPPAPEPVVEKTETKTETPPVAEVKEKPAPVKVKPRAKRTVKLPKPGNGTPPKDLTTGLPMNETLSTNPADKFEVARPVKSDDATAAISAWVKIDFFPSQQAARDFLNNLKSQNPAFLNARLRITSPFTRQDRTSAQIGPISSEADVQQVCAAAKQAGLNCSTSEARPSAIHNITGLKTRPQLNHGASVAGSDYDAPGNWIIQLGSYDSAGEAQSRWDSFKSQSPKLAKMENNIIESNGKFRLRAGNFASSSKADSLCDELRGKSISCIIVKL